MKVIWRIVCGVLALWLCAILYIAGIFSNSDSTLTKGELNHILKEMEEMKQQNTQLRKQAQELRELTREKIDFLQPDSNKQQVAKQMQQALDNIGDSETNKQHGEPSLEHEKSRRKIYNGVVEIWYYLKSQLKKLKIDSGNEDTKKKIDRILEDLGHQQRSILVDIDHLGETNGAKEWREKEAKELGDLVQKRLHWLQNPKDCSKAKKLVCDLNKGCGYGCQLHHVVYCMIMAYGTQRTLLLESKGWRYASKGWSSVFLPFSQTCNDRQGATSGVWGAPEVTEKFQVVSLPIVDGLYSRPNFLPLSIPDDLSERLLRLHGNPSVWWIGQVVKFLTRPQPHLADDMEESSKRLKFQRPIVGVHVRRTDKVGTEAAFHSIDEYMEHVEEYYQRLARVQDVPQKRVYLATDEPKLLDEAKSKFPDYIFVSDNEISKSASLNSRYTDNALRGVILDIHFLSLCDYVVCTFSSQVCRVAYEIMQTFHQDASTYFYSLDDIYYFGGQQGHEQVAIYSHEPKEGGEVQMGPGDVMGIAGNHWDGYSKGKNKRTGKVGLYPSYKVEEKIIIAKMPSYAEADAEN